MSDKKPTIEQFKNTLENQERGAEAVLDAFRARFEKDPVDAFEWSSSAFQAASTLAVLNKYIKALTEPTKVTPDILIRYLRGNVLSAARFPKHSTSFSSNEMDRCRLVALAELLKSAEEFFQ